MITDLTICIVTLMLCASYVFKVAVEECPHWFKKTEDQSPFLKEIEELKASRAKIEKLAEETQKLLSQANLSAGLSVRRPRP